MGVPSKVSPGRRPRSRGGRRQSVGLEPTGPVDAFEFDEGSQETSESSEDDIPLASRAVAMSSRNSGRKRGAAGRRARGTTKKKAIIVVSSSDDEESDAKGSSGASSAKKASGRGRRGSRGNSTASRKRVISDSSDGESSSSPEEPSSPDDDLDGDPDFDFSDSKTAKPSSKTAKSSGRGSRRGPSKTARTSPKGAKTSPQQAKRNGTKRNGTKRKAAPSRPKTSTPSAKKPRSRTSSTPKAKTPKTKTPKAKASEPLPPAHSSTGAALKTPAGISAGASGKKLRESMPLMLPKSEKSLLLIQMDAGALDLGGEIGAVGLFNVSKGARDRFALDIKGKMYTGQLTPCAGTFAVVSYGADDARVESVTSSFATLECTGSMLDSEKLISGTLARAASDDIDFDVNEEWRKQEAEKKKAIRKGKRTKKK